jgi:hypothetical protein
MDLNGIVRTADEHEACRMIANNTPFILSRASTVIDFSQLRIEDVRPFGTWFFFDTFVSSLTPALRNTIKSLSKPTRLKSRLWVQRKGTFTAGHFDGSLPGVLNFHLSGKKKWIIYRTTLSSAIGASNVVPFLSLSGPCEGLAVFTVGADEALYVPPCWTHCVETLEDSMNIDVVFNLKQLAFHRSYALTRWTSEVLVHRTEYPIIHVLLARLAMGLSLAASLLLFLVLQFFGFANLREFIRQFKIPKSGREDSVQRLRTFLIAKMAVVTR